MSFRLDYCGIKGTHTHRVNQRLRGHRVINLLIGLTLSFWWNEE